MINITPGTYYTNGTNNYSIIDLVDESYPFPQVVPDNERFEGGTVWIENIRTNNKAALSLQKFIAKIEAGELKPVTE